MGNWIMRTLFRRDPPVVVVPPTQPKLPPPVIIVIVRDPPPPPSSSSDHKPPTATPSPPPPTLTTSPSKNKGIGSTGPTPPAASPSTPDAADDAARSNLAAFVRKARSQLNMDVVTHYNFAFVGCSGCGKSSLINALRSLPDSAPGAAPVGETETTLEIKRYMHPTYPHIALWDIPGAGTLNQPVDVYFDKQLLYAFDTLLILSANRFFDVDFQVAKKAIEFKTPLVHHDPRCWV